MQSLEVFKELIYCVGVIVLILFYDYPDSEHRLWLVIYYHHLMAFKASTSLL